VCAHCASANNATRTLRCRHCETRPLLACLTRDGSLTPTRLPASPTSAYHETVEQAAPATGMTSACVRAPGVVVRRAQARNACAHRTRSPLYLATYGFCVRSFCPRSLSEGWSARRNAISSSSLVCLKHLTKTTQPRPSQPTSLFSRTARPKSLAAGWLR